MHLTLHIAGMKYNPSRLCFLGNPNEKLRLSIYCKDRQQVLR